MTNSDLAHCCSCTLCVVGNDLDPNEVTSAFGMEPHQSWQRGERKSFVSREGKVIYFESVHQDGAWKRFVPASNQDNPLHDQMRFWILALRGRRDTIQRYMERGWEVELNCLAQGSEVLVLSNTELRELAELGISLSLTLVGGAV